MSYQFVLDLLSKMIKEKEQEGPFIRSTTPHYLIKVIYLQNCLGTLFKEYLENREDGLLGKLFNKSYLTTLSLERILERNELKESQLFLIESLAEQSSTLSHMMIHVDEKTPTLEEVLKISNFISKNVEDILSTIPHEFEPKGTDFNQESMDWWKNRLISLSRK